ncbi:3'(2'),5'-bisphosphate nucleotidase CysQ [Rhodobacteraceae bacterium WD3A24]|nr:3'(2'),5'-bisphosphate nucleotidase CysQ [Rhodobacteraceae bacterium WD3A24]
MPGNDDLALLTEAAHAAGEIARRHFGADSPQWDKGAGQGPVSEADIEIDRMLRARLLTARPDAGWLSEETEDAPARRAARLSAREVFIVDPIDGTRAFLAGQKAFAHALAIARDGVVIAGVVYLPLLGLTYSATRDGGAWLNGERLVLADPPPLDGARLLMGRAQLAPELWPGGTPPVTPHFRPALAWRLCLVAEGRFDGVLTLRDAWHWDIAAGGLIAAEAGARVTDIAGRPLAFDTEAIKAAGLLAAPEPLHGDLLARLRPGARQTAPS